MRVVDITEEKLNSVWKKFIEDYKLVFLLNEIDGVIIDNFRKLNLVKVDKFRESNGEEDEYWIIYLEFKNEDEGLILSSSEIGPWDIVQFSEAYSDFALSKYMYERGYAKTFDILLFDILNKEFHLNI